MKPIPGHSACFLALTALSATLSAQQVSLQPVEKLQRFAETFVMGRLQPDGAGDTRIIATAGNVDSRLRLPECTGALQGLMPASAPTTSNMTVGVHCPSLGWKVYILVTVETELKVLVTRAAAARNSVPGAADVELQMRRVPGAASNYLTSTDQLRGHHLKVATGPGTALTTDMLAPDILIKRGQRVTLVIGSDGFEIQALGEAMADATPTGRVRVMNLSSRKIVEGQAETAGRVRVSL